jgi:glutamate synthase (NADPH/NADH) large chain
MMRKCHLNTCPVGVATQDPELRKRFAGKPEHVIRYLFYVAEEARALMASLGVRTLSGLVGRVEAIAPRDMGAHPRLSKIDFSELLYRPREATGPLRCIEAQDHNLAGVQDRALLPKVAEALEHKKPVRLEVKLRNGDRAFGAMLSGEVARRYGDAGLPEGTLTLTARGSAGQSFGAFLARGLTLDLHGDANDYVGKGLSGGVVVVRPPAGSRFTPDAQVIVGNTVLYGATAGKAFFNGRAGERFAVRNSGALAVVEGVGDHGCEYMTGGQVVVLGSTGRNFAAGMSGGTAYVLDTAGTFGARCNLETVELEPLAGPERDGVRKLVEEHLQRTGSPRALSVLDGWDKSRWVKVMPTEYKKLLAARALQQVPAPSPEAIASAPKGARS